MGIISQKITEDYAAYNGDCMEVFPKLKTNSIHLSVYSPPFSDLYNYSSDDEDMSNCRNYKQFLDQYNYLIKEIYRTTLPGRISAVHCMDIKIPGDNSSFRDFPGDIIRMYQDAGFKYQTRFCIWKEPFKVAIRTRALGLMHRQLTKDSTLCHSAGADYVLIFRKNGGNSIPVTHPDGLLEYAGERDIPEGLVEKYRYGWDDSRTNKLSQWIWRQYASSHWDDIRTGNVLPYNEARDLEEEKHVCPLQLDVIERIIILYSNEGETIATPFMGVGSEIYMAVKKRRKGIGVELKSSYFRQAMNNIEHAKDALPVSIFDIEEDEEL